MNPVNLLLLHEYSSDLLQIEVLKIRIQLLKKDKISRKKRIKFIQRLRNIQEELKQSEKEWYQTDLALLEQLLVLLGVPGPPPIKTYYELKEEFNGPEKVRFELDDNDETTDQPDYKKADADQPINLMSRFEPKKTLSPKENTFIPNRTASQKEIIWKNIAPPTPQNTIDLSEIVQAPWETPFGLQVFELLEQHETGKMLLTDLKDLCLECGADFSEPGHSFDRELIHLLNRPYVQPSVRIENELETLLNSSPESRERSEEILQDLDDLASTFRYRTLRQQQKEYLSQLQFIGGIHVRSERLTPEGIQKTLNSFVDLGDVGAKWK